MIPMQPLSADSTVPDGANAKPAPSDDTVIQPAAFYGFTTSVDRINRASGKISVTWRPAGACEAEAQEFIKVPPPRDGRENLSKHRFRLLVVDLPTTELSKLDANSDILKTAQEASWIGDDFLDIVNRGTPGSDIIETNETVSFVVQSPNDDDSPYFSFALSSSHVSGRQREPDWTCLFFGSPKISHIQLKELLEKVTYPGGYEHPLPPDFMILPTQLLLWEVDQVANAVTQLKSELVGQEHYVGPDARPEQFQHKLLDIRRRHHRTHLRSTFAKDFALSLAKCFDCIEERHQLQGREPARYPPALRQKVQRQQAILENIGRDLDNLPLRIEAQQSQIDAMISNIISKNSYHTANAARRDGTAMSTIAIMTLAFLPGTFVAAFFSMSMFDWQASEQDANTRTTENRHLVSKWIWLFFAVDTPLTLFILAGWYWWSRRREAQYSRRATEVES